jgi:hypothetical protein
MRELINNKQNNEQFKNITQQMLPTQNVTTTLGAKLDFVTLPKAGALNEHHTIVLRGCLVEVNTESMDLWNEETMDTCQIRSRDTEYQQSTMLIIHQSVRDNLLFHQ